MRWSHLGTFESRISRLWLSTGTSFRDLQLSVGGWDWSWAALPQASPGVGGEGLRSPASGSLCLGEEPGDLCKLCGLGPTRSLSEPFVPSMKL